MFDLMPFDRHETKRFNNYFNDLERNFFGELPSTNTMVHTDIIDKGDHYLLRADLPGFAKEEVKVDINGDMLTISAQHSEEKEEKEENFVRRERRYGTFARSFDITGIKGDAISGEFNNGVLELDLPKAGKEEPVGRRVELK